MMRSTRGLWFGLLSTVVFASSARAEDYTKRLSKEQHLLESQLRSACPDQGADIQNARMNVSPKTRRDALVALARCGAKLEAYHLKTGAAHFAVKDFRAAEKSYRAALAIRVTEAAQLSLLNALVRQKPRTKKQDADIKLHMTYFTKRQCSRDDLCAGLAYVAWHLGDRALTVNASERAIQMGFPGWQPYFFGASVLAAGTPEEQAKARRWLLEAKKRSGPEAVDAMLKAIDG